MNRPETTDARLTDLYALWDRLRGDRAMPDRADLPPELLKPWLGNLALIDVAEDGGYRYRLYGSNFVLRFGVEMTKRTVDDLPPEQSAAVKADYDAVVRSGQPLVRRYTGGFDIIDINRRLDVKRTETWERLVLPLANRGDTVALLLVAAFDQKPGEPPELG